MKLFVATQLTQGQRRNDYANPGIKAGEILTSNLFECDGEQVDGRCGCRRAFKGLESNFAITTALVKDIDMSEEELHALVRKNLDEGGWLKLGEKDENESWIAEELKIVMVEPSYFEVGTVVERRGKNLRERFLHEGGEQTDGS